MSTANPQTMSQDGELHRSWAREAVCQGLKQLAESHLQDFSALRQAGLQVPVPGQARWYHLVDQLHAQFLYGASDEQAAFRQNSFIKILKSLNENWFIPARVLLTRHPICGISEEDPPLWDLARVSVSRILETRRYKFEDAIVTTHILGSTPVMDLPAMPSGSYDGVQEFVTISHDKLVAETAWLRHACGLTPEPWELPILNGFTVTVDHAYVWHAERFVPNYMDESRLRNAIFGRTLAEEVRHAIDGNRVHRQSGQQTEMEYYARFSDLVLTGEGSLRQLWATTPNEERGFLGQVLSELSAQLTAAGVGPDLRMVLAEWWWRLVKQGTHQSRAFAERNLDSAYYAVRLLAEELGLARTPRGRMSWLRRDPADLVFKVPYQTVVHFAEKLLQLPVEKVRLAFKAIYAREFVLGAIDEHPFASIGPDGRLGGERAKQPC